MALNIRQIESGLFHAVAHPYLRRRFYLALVFAAVLFPLIALLLAVGTVFLVVPLFALLIFLSARTFFATLMGNAVLVSPANYPRIDTLVENLKRSIGYEKRVYVFVFENPSFNAFMAFLFFRRAVFLDSELLQQGVSDEELAWIIGRFVGYLRARREAGVLGWAIRATLYFPFFNLFSLSYERTLVYTGDRIAMTAIDGDVSSCISAMQKLLVGRELGYSINPQGIIDQQRRLKGTFFGFLSRLTTAYPHLTARYVDAILFARAFFPVQYARFEAENPGLPPDLLDLGVAEEAKPAPSGGFVSRRPNGWPVALATLALVCVADYNIWKSSRSAVDDVAAQLANPDSQLPVDSAPPAAGPAAVDSNQPQGGAQTPAAESTVAPPAGATTPVLPPNVHLDSQGRAAPDPGCHWASNDPHDFTVSCQ